MNRFLWVSIWGETPGPVLQSQVYPCVGSSNSHHSFHTTFIPLCTWKHLTSNFNYHCTNYIKSLTSPSDTAETSKTNCLWVLHFGKKALQRNTNRMFCASISFCASYCVSSEHFWLFIYCFFSSLYLFSVRQWKHVHEYARAKPGLCAREPGGLITAHSFCFKS